MGLKLKLKRIEMGFKQYEFAEKIGVSRYYLSALERNKVKNPSILIMKKISELLGVTVKELFFEE